MAEFIRSPAGQMRTEHAHCNDVERDTRGGEADMPDARGLEPFNEEMPVAGIADPGFDQVADVPEDRIGKTERQEDAQIRGSRDLRAPSHASRADDDA